MKKRLAALLLAALITSAVGCAPTVPPAPAAAEPTTTAHQPPVSEVPPPPETTAEAEDYKIGIITGTASQSDDELRQAETLKTKYGQKIVTGTYPDNFSSETEAVVSTVLAMATDPAVKVIVFCQAVPGASTAIDKTREIRPDMLFICGAPAEAPSIIAEKADIVLQADELAMGTTIVDEAVKMGAKNIVHYSFPRHMGYELPAARRDELRDNCEKVGIDFFETTAPDPLGESGVAGTRQFILDDVPVKVAELGQDTVFFATNCAMQEPLIKQVLSEKAMFVQQCCPSPYHGYPSALGIEIPADKKGDIPYILEQISAKVVEGENSGRMGTWPIPVNELIIESGVEYGIQFCEGKTREHVDDATLRSIINDTVAGYHAGAQGGAAMINTYDEDGVRIDNFYMILSRYIIF